eukprot:TRINITY_DN3589_c0_g1_i4.p1 TRINITY_DN3589_c0_g1~~TRINITY_DN3589_c0_g1_i4.p1  ORF type:complete len:314 (-),score=69.95 TRINITY_DN3589_c0_g1_i4:45-986(-)
MDDARALLDSLMGPSRDKSAQEQQRGDGWKEKNVCKRYLVGFCPNNAQDNWFHNTRRDIGVCTKVHSDRLRTDFEAHEDYARYKLEYERDFLQFLEGLVREADAWISRERGNCAAPGKVTRMTPAVREKVKEMQERSEQCMKQAEDRADMGDLRGSKEAVEMANKLKEDAQELKEKHTYMSGGEQVCDVCGVRCNPDEQADYQAHLDGKLHESYTQIRSRVKLLREKMRNPPANLAEIDRSSGGGGRDRDRDRDRDRTRSDRDREKGDRDRDRDRDRAKNEHDKKDKGDRGGRSGRGDARSRSRDRRGSGRAR